MYLSHMDFIVRRGQELQSSSYGEQRIMTPVNFALQFCRNSRSQKSFRSAITGRGTIRTFYKIVRRQADRSAHVDGATDNS
jgi:hypothetical protein